jgi:hypothetical protein
MGDVYANGRSILHKGDGNTHISAPPDVCKVPTPGGPVPTPFVNSAQDSMLSKGSKKTTIEGNSIALSSSEISLSSGDEPGTLGGLISSKFKGKMTWGGSSIDVKVEGKGVTRFLDPTLHNGNTFNINFVSEGGTGLAYGDDAMCEKCKRPPEKHRVHETNEVKGHVDAIFLELGKRFDEQKPLIDEYLRLRDERKSEDEKSQEKINQAEDLFNSWKNLKELEIKNVELELGKMPRDSREHSLTRGRITLLKNEIKKRKQELSVERTQIRLAYEALSKEMDTVKGRLKSMRPVLREELERRIYIEGYMVGACICKCRGKMPKMLAACSGKVADGFNDAVRAAQFEPVDAQITEEQKLRALVMGRKEWSCAAPKILNAGTAGGHKIKTMSERWYSPHAMASNPKVRDIVYERTDERGTRREPEDFGHGQSVPSCEVCQKILPESLCENSQECP